MSSSDVESGRLIPQRIIFHEDGRGETIPGREALPREIQLYRHLSNRGLLIGLEGEPDCAIEDRWKTDNTRTEIEAAIREIKDREGHNRFYSAHHTFAKSRIMGLFDALKSNQQERLANVLGISLNEGKWALANLYSNLTIGPSNLEGNPGIYLDATYYQIEGQPHLRMDPVSAEYKELDIFLNKISQEREKIEKISENEFTDGILNSLIRAEKIHSLLREGYKINRDTSMWEEVGDDVWKKVPIPISQRKWETMQIIIQSYVRDDISLSDLKRMFSS